MSFGTILTSLQGGHFDEPTGRSRTGWRGCRSESLFFISITNHPLAKLIFTGAGYRSKDDHFD